jgi:hypothetical protein
VHLSGVEVDERQLELASAHRDVEATEPAGVSDTCREDSPHDAEKRPLEEAGRRPTPPARVEGSRAP